jgi:hypothetical protein
MQTTHAVQLWSNIRMSLMQSTNKTCALLLTYAVWTCRARAIATTVIAIGAIFSTLAATCRRHVQAWVQPQQGSIRPDVQAWVQIQVRLA